MAITRAFKNAVQHKRRATPLVVNGNMAIAQRSSTVTGLGDGDEGYVTVDRFRHTAAASSGRFTSKQTAVADLDGFAQCLELDCTTADTSIASTELLQIDYRVEGQDMQYFKKGETNAEYITVSFYAKADAAVAYACELRDIDNGRHISKLFTTGTDWTHHVLSFPGDTTGNFGDDVNESLRVSLIVHAGSNFTEGTLAAAWASYNDANSAVGIGSFYAATTRSLKITGFQIEAGDYNATTLPPFQYESFEESLFRCQRYYIQNGAKLPPTNLSGATVWTHMMDFNPRMRAAPTNTHVATGGFSTVGGSADTTGVAAANLGVNGGRIALNLDATLTVNQMCQCALAANLDAEL